VLVATAGQGLLLITDGQAQQLFPGKFYGITRHENHWYAFQRQRWHGRIVRFDLSGNAEVALWGLSRGVHQIDVVDERLIVVDTYENRLLVFDAITKLRDRWWRSCEPKIHYPAGRLTSGRQSRNYHHFNSVLVRPEAIYLIAHNETSKTGRPSCLWTLDSEFLPVQTRALEASNAHNIVFLDQDPMYCASLEGTVCLGEEDVFNGHRFTRGLSLSSDQIVVGGSDVSHDRADRKSSDGYIWTLTCGFEEFARMTIKGGPVQEIRRVDAPDMGMSAAWNR
jgi:hypothetical protein